MVFTCLDVCIIYFISCDSIPRFALREKVTLRLALFLYSSESEHDVTDQDTIISCQEKHIINK